MLLEDTDVMNSAIHILMKFGDVAYAERLFSRMKRHDAYTYGVMLNGYGTHGKPLKCLMLFEQLKRHTITHNEALYIAMISACSKIGMWAICRGVLDQIPSQAKNTPTLKRHIIDMWVSVSYLDDSSDPSVMSSLDRAKLVLSMKPSSSFSRSLNLMLPLITP